MRKVTVILMLSWFLALFTQAGTNEIGYSYFVNETFTGATAWPNAWSDAQLNTGSSINFNTSGQVTLSGSGSGDRGGRILFPSSNTATTVYVDFDFFIANATVGKQNALGITLTDALNNNILSVYLCGNDAKFHYWNIEKDSVTFTQQTMLDYFNRASTDLNVTNTRNVGSRLDLAFQTGV